MVSKPLAITNKTLKSFNRQKKNLKLKDEMERKTDAIFDTESYSILTFCSFYSLNF